MLAASVLVGQFISGISGMMLIKAMEKADIISLVAKAGKSRG